MAVRVRSSRRALATGVPLVAVFACFASSSARPAAVAALPAPIAVVNVDSRSAQRQIPSDFDGLSMEFKNAAQNFLGVGGAPNTAFEQLMRNLGRSRLRIGGSSTDISCWEPEAAPYPQGCRFEITQNVLRGYLDASAQTGWSLIVGVNLGQNDAKWAAAYGAAVARVANETPGSSLIGFEFGNEPDQYRKHELFADHPGRPRDYSWSDLVADWMPYVTAFKGQASTSTFAVVGPAYDGAAGWKDRYLEPFVQGVGANRLGILTVHQYAIGGCHGQPITIDQLLSTQLIAAYRQHAQGWVGVANRAALPLELDETGAATCLQGKKGIVDVFAGALWGLDWLFTNAQLGMRAINFHSGYSLYSPIWSTGTRSGGEVVYHNQPAPLYYAMYAFNNNAENATLLRTTVDSHANITAYAVRDTAGHLRVFVLNKDLNAAGPVTIHLSSPMGVGSLLRISAPSIASQDISYGGASFDGDTGRLRGAPARATIAPDARGDYNFTLDNASIVIVDIGK